MLTSTYFDLASPIEQPDSDINLFNLSLSFIGLLPILLYALLILDDVLGIFS